ncbi:hypothetical protein [uncultured Jatrophihabitans sp.]|uniref:hypothetical protein n=1 Tax=uncultured Jatrophihabitans sp. TaxID=1610747 RepID=UPI0035C94E31
MTSHDVPGPDERLDNGLRALAYVPLTDVDAEIGRQLLTALARARIAAYLGELEAAADHRRLFVAAEERVDARTIVRATVRALGSVAADVPDEPTVSLTKAGDPLAGLDTDAIFAELVADWHVDTHSAIRRAERDLTREDAEWRARLGKPPADEEPEWLDDDHYVPPPPPPLPRLSMPAVLGIVVLILSIFLLAAGTVIGLADNVARVLGIAGLLVGVGVLLTRVRDFHRDEDDDGAAI